MILKTAVRDGKVMQDFELESLKTVDAHSQMVKGATVLSDSGSKDCVNLPSPTAVFRMIRWLLIFVSVFAPLTSAFAQSPESDKAKSLLLRTAPHLPDESILTPEGDTGFGYPDLTTQAVVLILLALSPFIIMLLTSFMKMVITLALLRSALGTQQTPPNQVLNGIALIMTIYVMYPTGLQMYHRAEHIINGGMPKKLFSSDSAAVVIDILEEVKGPFKDFLVRNTTKKHIDGFLKIAMKTFPEEVLPSLKADDFIIVIPAFITSQLKSAFEIGVLIYLPFFVIDIVTSNILLAMQMMMLSPLSIALPLKLLLIVMINGWTVIVEGLILSYN